MKFIILRKDSINPFSEIVLAVWVKDPGCDPEFVVWEHFKDSDVYIKGQYFGSDSEGLKEAVECFDEREY